MDVDLLLVGGAVVSWLGMVIAVCEGLLSEPPALPYYLCWMFGFMASTVTFAMATTGII